jgi:macrolide-specific efflux system membrane fusion protein
VKVSAPIEGTVTTFHVDVGADVYEGQLLAEIRSDMLDSAQQAATAELERAQTRVQNLESALSAARLESSRATADAIRAGTDFDRATRNFQRQKLLLGEGATPRQVFEKAEKEYTSLLAESKQLAEVAKQSEERISSASRELDSARKLLEGKLADMEAAKSRLEAGQVISPATGTIAARRGQPGDEVNPEMDDLFQIATSTSALEVLVEPSPADLLRIKPGQEALVNVADIPNEVLPGKVSSVEEGKVRIEFSNPSALVKPGQTAQVRIRVT